jgi:hypothetical protein
MLPRVIRTTHIIRDLDGTLNLLREEGEFLLVRRDEIVAVMLTPERYEELTKGGGTCESR